MIQQRYPGLVIGGPMDGEIHEGRSPSFEIAEQMPMHFVNQPHLPNDTVKVWRYHYMPTVAGIHFWLAEGETPESVLTKLTVAYIKVKTLDL